MTEFVSTKQVTARTSLSRSTMYRLRLCGELEEGVHYSVISRTKVVYNMALILDWMANRHQPENHETAIRNYLDSLPSSQPSKKKPGRKPKE